ncbi:MAG TPA: FG-GAP-like repeat-containing protein, partial [Candidatus Peribacterales bacterium]|nr:FG-GAP-like repeat-containing protein [Candidatus Peribacterales bacterium]
MPLPLPRSPREVAHSARSFVALCRGHCACRSEGAQVCFGGCQGTLNLRIRIPEGVRRRCSLQREDLWIPIPLTQIKRKINALIATIVLLTNILPSGDALLQIARAQEADSGEAELTEVQPMDRFAGTVFEDRNQNGIQDEDEPGLSGVTMELTQGEERLAEVKTGEDGSYEFINHSLEGSPFGDEKSTNDIVILDLDNDQDDDVILGNGNAEANTIHWNDAGKLIPGGNILNKSATGSYASTTKIFLHDTTGNGRFPDAIVGNLEGNELYFNEGNGTFRYVGHAFNPEQDRGSEATGSGTSIEVDQMRRTTQAIVAIDVDHDGRKDIITGNGAKSSPEPNNLYLANADGSFTYAGEYFNRTSYRISDETSEETETHSPAATFALEAIDLDSDGDDDLLIGNENENELYVNDETGLRFAGTLGGESEVKSATKAWGFLDIDNDTDLDILAVNDGPNILYRNNFTEERVLGEEGSITVIGPRFNGEEDDVDTHASHAVSIFDLNGDDLPDVLLGNVSGSNELYINRGVNTVEGEKTGTGASTTGSGATTTESPEYAFDLYPVGSELSETKDVEHMDIDRDGDPDIVIGTSDDSANLLYRNRIGAVQVSVSGATLPGGYIAGGNKISIDATLAPGIDEDDLSFGFVPTALNGTAEIRGKIFIDSDLDAKDPGIERGLASTTLVIEGKTAFGSDYSVSAITDVNGEYAFKDVPLSAMPEGGSGSITGEKNSYTLSLALDALPTTYLPVTATTMTLVLAEKDAVVQAESFGIQDLAQSPGLGEIRGRVLRPSLYRKMDPEGVAGIRVRITGSIAPLAGMTEPRPYAQEVVSAEDGSFVFVAPVSFNQGTRDGGMPGEGYRLSIDEASLPDGYTVETPPENIVIHQRDEVIRDLELHLSENTATLTLIVQQTGADGVLDETRPIGGVLLSLHQENTLLTETRTDPSGHVAFALRPGVYSVTLAQASLPVGYTLAVSDTAIVEITGKDADTSMSFPVEWSHDCAGALCIGGAAWHDADSDGKREVGERGIPDLPLLLTGTRVDGTNEELLRGTTDASGDYLLGLSLFTPYTDAFPGIATLTNASTLAAIDIEGDGDRDLIIGKYGNRNELFLNDGKGMFTSGGERFNEGFLGNAAKFTSAITVTDLNGDGKEDVLIGNRGQINERYINNGDGTFTFMEEFGANEGEDRTYQTAGFLLGNFVGGSAEDVLVLNTLKSQNELYENTGNALRYVGQFFNGANSAAGRSTVAGSTIDSDGDKEFDHIFLGNDLNEPNELYELDKVTQEIRFVGNMGFGSLTSKKDASTKDVVAFDMNGDGREDIAVAHGATGDSRDGGRTAPKPSEYYLNQGDGIFTYHKFPGHMEEDTEKLLTMDMDRDGDEDLLFINKKRALLEPQSALRRLERNDGFGTFTDLGDPILNAEDVDRTIADAITTDVNGDGTLDLIILYAPDEITEEDSACCSVFLGSANDYMAFDITAEMSLIPAELTETTPSSYHIDPGVDGNKIARDFGFVASPSLIQGIAYLDKNGNGLQEVNETDPVKNATVLLSGQSVFGEKVERETATSGTGYFAFANIPPSRDTAGYILRMLEQENLTPTTPLSRTIVILAGGTLEERSFGFSKPVIVEGSVTEFLNLQRTSTGSLTGSTVPLAGVILKLSGINPFGDPIARVTTTGTGGSFQFAALPFPRGAYTLALDEETVPTNLIALDESTRTIEVAAGGETFREYFYFVAESSIEGRARMIIGTGSSVPDPGVTLRLIGNTVLAETVNRTLTTDTIWGTYAFIWLVPGDYTLTVEENSIPTGFIAVPSELKVTILSGGTVMKQDIKLLQSGSGSGTAENESPSEEEEEPAEEEIPEEEIIEEELPQPEVVEGEPPTLDTEEASILLEHITDTAAANRGEALFRLTNATVEGKLEGETLTTKEALTTMLNAGTTEEDVEEFLMQEIVEGAVATVVGDRTDLTEGIAADMIADTDTADRIKEAIAPFGLTFMVSDDTMSETIGEALNAENVQGDIAQSLVTDPLVQATVETIITGDSKEAIVEAIVDKLVTEEQAFTQETVAGAAREAMQEDPKTLSTLTTFVEEKLQTEEVQNLVLQNVEAGREEGGEATPILEEQKEDHTIEIAPGIMISLKNHAGTQIPIDPAQFTFSAGSVILVLSPVRRFTPGLYTLTLRITNPITGETETFDQDFTWGVLAMNPDKDRYRQGETADMHFGVLDDEGEIVCDASLSLIVDAPDGSRHTLSSGNGLIETTGTCGVKQAGFIKPDYKATYFFTEGAGTYTFHLTAETANGVREMTQEVEVGEVPSISAIIRRQAATRLWPFAPSAMTIEVEFLNDFTGTITDTIPDGFTVSDLQPTSYQLQAVTDEQGSATTITWENSWKSGETATFSYIYDAPDISPEFYLIGPLQLKESSPVSMLPIPLAQVVNNKREQNGIREERSDNLALSDEVVEIHDGLSKSVSAFTAKNKNILASAVLNVKEILLNTVSDLTEAASQTTNKSVETADSIRSQGGVKSTSKNDSETLIGVRSYTSKLWKSIAEFFLPHSAFAQISPEPETRNQKLETWYEARAWMIANDAGGIVRVWDAGGADTNWSTAANWSGDTVPDGGSIAVFDGTGKNSPTVDASFGGHVGGVKMGAAFTGTITLA